MVSSSCVTRLAVILSWSIVFQFDGNNCELNRAPCQINHQSGSHNCISIDAGKHSLQVNADDGMASQVPPEISHLLANDENEIAECPYNSSTEFVARISSEQEETSSKGSTEKLRPPVSKDTLDRDIYTRRHLGASENYFYHLEELHNKSTVAEIGWMALTSKLQCSVYSDMFSHRYDSFQELKVSGGPLANNELCLKQLNNLIERAEIQSREGYSSKDINLYQLLDSYGRVPPGLLEGHASWLGVYSECVQMKIQFPDGPSPTSYCWAHIRYPHWPANELMSEVAVLKSGVCLPKSCDSTNYKDKYELVYKLISFHERKVDVGQANITSLYCLPDEESPLRIWWQNPKSLMSLGAIMSWCLFLVFCTIKSEQATGVSAKEEFNTDEELETADSYGKNANSTDRSDFSKRKMADNKQIQRRENATKLAIYRSLSITNNLSLLFNTTKQSSLLQAGNKLKRQFSSEEIDQQVSGKKKIVDLSCLEGIKVMCMSYVIMGHVLMCLTTVIMNGREAASSTSPTFFIANLVPAFAVNSFFTITAILTSYLMFKQNQSYSFLTSPLKWAAFILYRYLRIMPMYLIVVLYTKHLAKYAGSGPLWDYGTSSLGQRRACENESWLWTILFGANFKSPLDHCIPSAWYLANDFQFFMVTPIFLALLHKSPVLGTKIIKGCIGAGFIACFMSVYLAEVDDLKPVARFMPHGFKTYVTHLYANYTQPQYRIPAYLCGLLIGFVLHQFEQDKLKYLAAKKEAASSNKEKQLEGDNSTSSQALVEPDWSDNFKNRGVFYSAFFVFLCCITPVIGSRIPFNKSAARFMVALIMPSYHMLFSLSVGLYILLATTGYGSKRINGILAASFWKPLARLSLCAVLINVEVINYFIQSYRTFQYFDNEYQFSLNMLCILYTYLAAIVMCVIFEAPMRAALNHLLSYAITKVSSKQKAA